MTEQLHKEPSEKLMVARPVWYVSGVLNKSINDTPKCKQTLVDFSCFACPPLQNSWQQCKHFSVLTSGAYSWYLGMDRKRKNKTYISSTRPRYVFRASKVNEIKLSTLDHFLTLRCAFLNMDGDRENRV